MMRVLMMRCRMGVADDEGADDEGADDEVADGGG